MHMVTLANLWEEPFIYSCFQIPQDLEGKIALLLIFSLFSLRQFFFSNLSVHFQDTKEAVSAKDVSRKEPITGVIALKASMKYFDADFFNDSKVLSKCYLKFSQPSSCINIFFIYTSICSVSFGRWKMVQKNLMYLHLETTGNWWR